MNYYPFHIGDFRSGTSGMSRRMRWIYRDMIDVYYDSESPLTLNIEDLCFDLGVIDADEKLIVEQLLRFKFKKTELGYLHVICDAVILDYRGKAETAKANGKLGGRPSKNNPNKPSGFQSGSNPVPSANPELTQSKANETQLQANQEPRTKNQEPRTKNQEPKQKKEQKALALSRPESVPEKVWNDFLEIRKKRRAPLTETAFDGIAKEAEKAGLTLGDCLALCCSRGWQSFGADWDWRPRSGQKAAPQNLRDAVQKAVDDVDSWGDR